MSVSRDQKQIEAGDKQESSPSESTLPPGELAAAPSTSVTALILDQELMRGTWHNAKPPKQKFEKHPNNGFKYAESGNISYPWAQDIVSEDSITSGW